MPRAFYFRSDHISTAHIIIFHSHENVKPTKLRNISTLAFLCKPQSFFFSFVLLLLFEIAHEKYYIHKLYSKSRTRMSKRKRDKNSKREKSAVNKLPQNRNRRKFSIVIKYVNGMYISAVY